MSQEPLYPADDDPNFPRERTPVTEKDLFAIPPDSDIKSQVPITDFPSTRLSILVQNKQSSISVIAQKRNFFRVQCRIGNTICSLIIDS